MSTRKADQEEMEAGTLVKKAKKEKIRGEHNNVLDLLLMSKADIWVGGILPFLGPGHFIFVALVRHRLKDLYLQYLSSIKKLPIVSNRVQCWEKEEATISSTFYSSVFSSLSCAKYWHYATNGHGDSLSRYRVCQVVAKHGNLEVLKWARQRGFPWNVQTCNAAASNGHMEILKHAHANHCRCDEYTCARAAENGHLEILKWLHNHGCPWNRSTCAEAAANGHLDILQYVRAKGCPWDKSTCYWAARKGQLEILKWAHDNGCPWDSETCAGAAQGGHLKVLQYAHQNGCPWDSQVCTNAAEKGHLHIVEYACKYACPGSERLLPPSV